MRKKLIAAGVGLFGYGALLGWAITGDRIEKKMKENQRTLADIISRQASELAAAKSLVLEQATEAAQPVEMAQVDVDDDGNPVAYDEVQNEDGEEAVVKTLDERWRGESPEETRTNLQRLINQYNPEDEEAFVQMANRTLEDNGPDNTPPFVIAQATFSWDEEGEEYSKGALTYYPNDRVLVDNEDEDVIDNKEIDSLVGWANLNRFGDQTDNPDTVFVRNRRLEKDFEIFRDTENPLPAHIRFGFDRHEFETHQAAGLTRFRRDDV